MYLSIHSRKNWPWDLVYGIQRMKLTEHNNKGAVYLFNFLLNVFCKNNYICPTNKYKVWNPIIINDNKNKIEKNRLYFIIPKANK